MDSPHQQILEELEQQLALIAGTDFLSPEMEAAVLKFKQLEQQFTVMYKAGVKAIEHRLTELDPAFRKITGSALSMTYSPAGAAYAISELADTTQVLRAGYAKATITPDTEAIEAYREKHGTLPPDIIDKERSYSLRITPKKSKA